MGMPDCQGPPLLANLRHALLGELRKRVSDARAQPSALMNALQPTPRGGPPPGAREERRQPARRRRWQGHRWPHLHG